MTITKDMMARSLAENTGYYLKDIKVLLAAMDDFVKDSFAQVTDDEDITIQIVEGVKLSVHVVPERTRVNPQNQEPVTVKATVKPSAKFSSVLRETLQKQYDRKLGNV